MEGYPSFIIIGAMKAGTTTLYRWLDLHPDCTLPAVKEPAFFALEDRWNRGLKWYRSIFPEGHTITGEASVIYTDPIFAPMAAERMSSTLPDVRLVFVARHPVERARSHYIHQVQRGRERRTFEDAIRAPNNPYLRRSCYFSALKPFIDRFSPAHLLVVWFEELFTSDQDYEWRRLLKYLGLSGSERPIAIHNRTAERPIWSRTGRWIFDTGFRAAPSWLPKPIRSVARALLTNDSSQVVKRLISSADDDMSGSLPATMWEDVELFLAWAGSSNNRWK